MSDTIPAHVQDLSKLKGQWFRSIHSDKIYQVITVGTAGVSLKYAGHYGSPGVGQTYIRPFDVLRDEFNIMVSPSEIQGIKG